MSEDRRKTRRRSLPFVRSAVLDVRGRHHIVAVQDLSADGAFLSTRLSLQDGERARLRTVLPRDGREVTIPCQVVWTSEKLDAPSGRPAGVAVRFVGLDPTIQRRLAEFSEEGFTPGPEPTPAEHYEYRLLESAGGQPGRAEPAGPRRVARRHLPASGGGRPAPHPHPPAVTSKR